MQGVPIWLIAMLATMAGAIWGSFAAALVYRWPKGESVTEGRSACPHCHTVLKPQYLVPLFSYALAGGRCRSCAAKISPIYPIIEGIAVAIGIIPLLVLPPQQAIAAAIFGWAMLPSLILDWQHLWLPRILTCWIAATGLLIGPILMPAIGYEDRLIAATGAYLVLEGLRRLFLAHRGRDGMGAGDPLFLAAIGIWLGWRALPVLLLLACGMGLLWAIVRMAERKQQPLFPLGTLLGTSALLLAWFPLAI